MKHTRSLLSAITMLAACILGKIVYNHIVLPPAFCWLSVWQLTACIIGSVLLTFTALLLLINK